MSTICLLGAPDAQHWIALAEQAHYSAPKLAELVELSTRQLRRKIHDVTGCSPESWLEELKVVAAAGLLRSGLSIKEVSLQLGFKQVSHFCRKFKEYHSLTPSQFVARAARSSSFQSTHVLGQCA